MTIMTLNLVWFVLYIILLSSYYVLFDTVCSIYILITFNNCYKWVKMRWKRKEHIAAETSQFHNSVNFAEITIKKEWLWRINEERPDCSQVQNATWDNGWMALTLQNCRLHSSAVCTWDGEWTWRDQSAHKCRIEHGTMAERLPDCRLQTT